MYHFRFFRFISKTETDSDLLQQLEIYELQLKQEDEEQSPFVDLDYSNQQQ